MLSPGSYQFHGKYKGDLVSERPLEWRVVCATKAQTIIGRGLIMRGGNSRELKDLDFPITVPATNCPAQYIKLVFDARSASEKFISGSIWFDDFQIASEETSNSGASTSEASTSSPESSAASPTGVQKPATTPNANASPETGVAIMPPKPGGMEMKAKIFDPTMAPITLPPPSSQPSQ